MRTYQPEIEGLRAIAVLAVLLFHFDIRGFSGGFVGVDMFFVISGYLISKNILSELDAGKFNLKAFYIRRVFRLLPALFVTIAATLIVSYFILTPEHFANLGNASVASVFSVSNFLFWLESGYFDQEKIFKPLLHTWSLAVEEQFYLLWPLLLIFLCSINKKYCLFGVVFLATISVLVSQRLLSSHESMVFYLMPFRVSEFAIGALLVFFGRSSNRMSLPTIYAVVGLVLVLGSVVFFNDQVLFPGFMALIPCLGTALLIRYGHSSIISPVLANSFFCYIGKISYSLYLVHWPIIVLVSYWKLGGIGVKSLLVIVPVTFLLASILHHQVEQRFREPRLGVQKSDARKKVAKSHKIVLIALALSFIGMSITVGEGWVWRYPNQAQVVVNAVHGLSDERDKKRQRINQYQASFQKQDNIDRHYIIGDSFAEDTMLALKFSEPELNLKLLKIPAQCQPVLSGDYNESNVVRQFCNQKRMQVFTNPELKNATTIYYAASWREPAFSYLAKSIAYLKQQSSAKVIIFGPRASFHDVPTLAIKHAKEQGLNEFVNKFKSQVVKQNIAKLQNIAELNDIKFVNVYQLMCPNDICTIISPLDGKIIYSDHAHLTLSGAKYLSEQMLKGYN